MIEGALYGLQLARLHAAQMEQELQRLREENEALRAESQKWAESATSAELTGKPGLRPVKP